MPLGFVLIDPRKCVLYISASQGYNYAAQRNEISVNVIYFISTVRLGYPSFNKYIPSRTIPGALILLNNCTNQYPTQSLWGQFNFLFCFQCIRTSNKRKRVGEGYLCYFNSICYIWFRICVPQTTWERKRKLAVNARNKKRILEDIKRWFDVGPSNLVIVSFSDGETRFGVSYPFTSVWHIMSWINSKIGQPHNSLQ